jgi:hypothetical protein
VAEVGKFKEFVECVHLQSCEESCYAVIASHMDESFDMGSRGIFAVGGLLGRGVALFELDRKWEKLRQRKDINIAYFKASECWLGCGEFAKFVATERRPTHAERQRLDAISEEFIRIIQNEPVVLQAIGVPQKEFYEVIQDPYASDILGESPFRLAYDLAMVQCAWVMKQLKKHDRVCFFSDESERYSPLAEPAYRKLKDSNPEAEKYMATYSEGNEKDYDGLQAADACIYEMRRVLGITRGEWPGPARKQFYMLREAHRIGIIRTAEKDNLLNIVAMHKPGEPFRLDAIMEDVFHENVEFNL